MGGDRPTLIYFARTLVVLMSVFFAGCSGSGLEPSLAGAPSDIRTAAIGVPPSAEAARLEKGDKIGVVVFNEKELSGEFLVDSTGSIAFPLVGEVQVAGLTAREAEQRLTQKLNGRYLINPRVSVEILSQRPVYVMGEVAKAGEYPYRAGLNVVSAVALAGGFSPRAATGTVTIRRHGQSQAEQVPAQPNIPVFPGDLITVHERLF